MHKVAMLLGAGTTVDVTTHQQGQVLGQRICEVDENRSSVGQVRKNENLLWEIQSCSYMFLKLGM